MMTTSPGSNYALGVRRRQKPLKGEPNAGRHILLKIRISARNSRLLTPFILPPIESLRPRLAFVLGAFLAASSAFAAPTDSEAVLKSFFDEALAHSPAYSQLTDLTTRYPGRLSGSSHLEGALTWAESLLGALKLDRVWTQPVVVPHWERGAPERITLLTTAGQTKALSAAALGGSVATPEEGITAGVIEVQSLAELEILGKEKIEGKIVFFNRPMNPTSIAPGRSYGEAGDQRNRGPGVAASYGAVAALTRSLTHASDDVPHTGNTTFQPKARRIPAAALSTQAADTLSAALRERADLQVRVSIHARWMDDVPSHNLIGELRGTEFPSEILLVGGHLDSWDIAPGAHDDGAGVVQSIEVLRLYQALGLKPRHTLRCVLFVNEENGSRGAAAYATAARGAQEKHILALETDNGGFQPRGFNLGSTQFDPLARIERWRSLLAPYGLTSFVKGTGGADVGPLMALGAAVGELTPDSQRYFDIHHTVQDSIDKVNARELQLGAASLAALLYLVDTQGW